MDDSYRIPFLPFDATGFRYDDYFNPEGLSLGILGRLFGHRKKSTCPMTIKMLIESAASGHWQDKST
jgi:hypothetical protein